MATGIKGLVGQRMTQDANFMGKKVEIAKLSVSQVMEIQEKSKNLNEDDETGFEILKLVVRTAVQGGDELTDDDFRSFPLDELSKLSAKIMEFSGIGAAAGK